MRDPQDPWADERAMTGPSAHELWSANQHRDANRSCTYCDRDAIRACHLCDTHGLRDGLPCRHIDHAAAAKRGLATIRAQMGWNTPTGTTTPEPPQKSRHEATSSQKTRM